MGVAEAVALTMDGALLPVQLLGAHALVMAVFHSLFWRLFDWRRELAKLRLPTRAITQILNLRLIWLFLFVALLCLSLPDALLCERSGQALLAFMLAFWLGRLLEQFMFLRVRHALVTALSAWFVLGVLLAGWAVHVALRIAPPQSIS